MPGNLMDRIRERISILEILTHSIQFQRLEIGFGGHAGPLMESVNECSLTNADGLANFQESYGSIEIGEHVTLSLAKDLCSPL